MNGTYKVAVFRTLHAPGHLHYTMPLFYAQSCLGAVT